MNAPKKLYKSRTDKMFEGVCAGLAEYFNVDPTLIRLGFALAVLGGFGSGILFYIVLAVVMPEAPSTTTPEIETPVQDEFDFDLREREVQTK